MKVLLVAATLTEIEPLLKRFNARTLPAWFTCGNFEISALITGVGMVNTAFELGKHLAQNQYDLALNAGIAGSFDHQLAIGQVLHITDDAFADLGAEDGDEFLSIDELGFGKARVSPIIPSITNHTLHSLAKVNAISVNRVHGHEMSIAKTIARLKPQLESMEGAAFFHACNQFQLPAIQIRAISNEVERRNREKWNIGLAVKNLNDCLIDLFNDKA